MSEKITQEMCNKKLSQIIYFLKQNGYLVKNEKAITATWANILAHNIIDLVTRRKELSPTEQWKNLTLLECWLPPEYKRRLI